MLARYRPSEFLERVLTYEPREPERVVVGVNIFVYSDVTPIFRSRLELE